MTSMLKNDKSIKMRWLDDAKYCSGRWYIGAPHKWHVPAMYHRASCVVIQNNPGPNNAHHVACPCDNVILRGLSIRFDSKPSCRWFRSWCFRVHWFGTGSVFATGCNLVCFSSYETQFVKINLITVRHIRSTQEQLDYRQRRQNAARQTGWALVRQQSL